MDNRASPWRHRFSSWPGWLLEAQVVFSSTFTSVMEQRFENANYRLIDLRSEMWHDIIQFNPPFFSLSLSAAVPRNSQLPPSVEHASVMAVWDWSVQSHLPLHLRPEELLHRWVNRHTAASAVVGVRRCAWFRAVVFIINQARYTNKITCSLFYLGPLRSDPGLGERQRPRYLLLRALFLEVQDAFPPVWDDLGCKPAQLDRLFHQAAGEW